MKILDLSTFGDHFSDALSAEQLKNSLVESGAHLRDLVVSSANDGNSFGQVERTVFQALKKIGFGAMALLIKLQGDDDLERTKRTEKDSDGLNHWQLLIQKYFEFLSGLVSWVGDVWIF